MIPVGYMAKHVAACPASLGAPHVEDIYSVSGCVSTNFADYVGYWKHNGYWFFDSPQIIRRLAQERALDLSGTKLFYYEVYERQFDDRLARWLDFGPERSLETAVVPPAVRVLEGYDVVTFSAGTAAECSPLSCNALAREIETNRHCLLPSLARAQQLLEAGRFKNTEPGPFRIYAVYSTKWPD